ncbi:MAG: diguanylate cyclase [Myxococcaceae bacterium]
MKRISRAGPRAVLAVDPRPTVLYVEDDPDNWAIAELRLSRRYNLLWARSDVEACALLKHSPSISALLMDIELKGSTLSGLELSRILKGQRGSAQLPTFAKGISNVDVPIIFVTAHVSRYPQEELLAAGAAQVIRKPVNFSDLALALDEVQSHAPRGDPSVALVELPPVLRELLIPPAEAALSTTTALTARAARLLGEMQAVASSLPEVSLLMLRRALAGSRLAAHFQESQLRGFVLGALLDVGLAASGKHDVAATRQVARMPSAWRVLIEKAVGDVDHAERSARHPWVHADERTAVGCHHHKDPPADGLSRLGWLTERVAGCFDTGEKEAQRASAQAGGAVVGLAARDIHEVITWVGDQLPSVLAGIGIAPPKPVEAVVALQQSYDELASDLVSLSQEKDLLVERLADANRNLARAVGTDALTTLLNQGAWIDGLKRYCAQAARSLTPVSLLMIDIDHFKRINDAYGHQAGNTVLHEIARALAGCVRTSDLLGRYGGEEFAVVLPNTVRASAALLAERIRASIEQLRFEGPLHDLCVTVSVGVGCSDGRGLGPDQLIESADVALYQAKEKGRNRTEGSIAPG